MNTWIRPHLYRLGQYRFRAPSGPTMWWNDHDWISFISKWYLMDDFGDLTLISVEWSNAREEYIAMLQPFKPSGYLPGDTLEAGHLA